MAPPPLVNLADEAAYRAHYIRTYCKAAIATFDGIPIHFSPNTFDHAFFESSARNGVKDLFSAIRAERIEWIKATLEHPNADLYAGWMKSQQQHDDRSRVAVVHNDFVVVVRMKLVGADGLRGNFITCYEADNSIAKIRACPRWSRDNCVRMLGGTP